MIKFREHAKVGATLYSLPWRYLGERVDARSTTTMPPALCISRSTGRVAG